MNNLDIISNISQGIYVLTTSGGGCIVDAVSQVSSGDNPLIAVAVMKKNNTNKLLKENNKFALSILSEEANPKIIETFGMHTMANYDKFDKVSINEVSGLKVISDSIGYIICEIVDSIDTETHDLFIGRVVEADKFNNQKEMTYQYYREHKDEMMKVVTNNNKTAWICTICGYIYYGEELPKDFICPICGAVKELFEKRK